MSYFDFGVFLLLLTVLKPGRKCPRFRFHPIDGIGSPEKNSHIDIKTDLSCNLIIRKGDNKGATMFDVLGKTPVEAALWDNAGDIGQAESGTKAVLHPEWFDVVSYASSLNRSTT